MPGEEGEMQETQPQISKGAGPAGAVSHCKKGHHKPLEVPILSTF